MKTRGVLFDEERGGRVACNRKEGTGSGGGGSLHHSPFHSSVITSLLPRNGNRNGTPARANAHVHLNSGENYECEDSPSSKVQGVARARKSREGPDPSEKSYVPSVSLYHPTLAPFTHRIGLLCPLGGSYAYRWSLDERVLVATFQEQARSLKI